MIKTYDINGTHYTIVPEFKNTNYGFSHKATLMIDSIIREKYTTKYYNRTWEAYEFQTVMYGLISKALKDKELKEYRADLEQIQQSL